MKYCIYLFVGLSLLALGACQQHGASEQDELLKDIMADHDSIMPRVGVFVRYNMALDSVLDQLPAQKLANPTLDTTAKRTKLLAIKSALESATDSMNEWMANFEPDQSEKTAQEAKDYLEAEKGKLEKMKVAFKNVDSLLLANPLR
ncbi:hypothetical protein [Olivibacter sitiensis]|uniref:hypothetical protein n=1 Tax=Olivibacter sitiensis TaxID=376470 RepID=UPI0004018DC0|nr:hypothetical protein [Olivibacter sitiensis]